MGNGGKLARDAARAGWGGEAGWSAGDHWGWGERRDNPHYCEPFSISFDTISYHCHLDTISYHQGSDAPNSRIVNLCNFSAILAGSMRGW